MACVKSLSKAILCVLMLSLTLGACSSSSKLDPNTAEGAFKLGEKFEKDERYEEAIVQFSNVKNKHPYSKLAVDAKLRIADIYYKREEFIEAQTEYQTFKEMHPTNPRNDYVTYQLAMSFFNQLPSTIDRDLSVAERAILYFDEVIQSYATSQYTTAARENKRKALTMLAEKEYYIGNFYFIREHWDSALGRFEDLLAKYPGLGLDAKALFGAAYSALKMKEMAKARGYYQQLLSQHKDSAEAEKARREIGSRI